MECGPQLKPEEPEYPDIPKVSYRLGVQTRYVRLYIFFKNSPPPRSIGLCTVLFAELGKQLNNYYSPFNQLLSSPVASPKRDIKCVKILPYTYHTSI